MMHKRNLLLVALALVSLGHGERACAQGYPSRPVTIVVPFSAGGTADVIARILSERMRLSLAQPVIVENVVGVGRVARAAPDGYTLIAGHWGTHVVNAATYELPYDLRSAFEPIALTATGPQLIVAKKTMPANDLRSLVAWLKAHPGKALMGTAGAGAGQVNGLLFQQMTNTRFQFVPYRGLPPAVQDLVAGQIDLMMASVADLLPQARVGAIKAFAVSAKRRLTLAPDIPTADEAGVPGFYTQMWHGLWAPARTPNDVVAKLNAAVVEALADTTVRQRLSELGQEIPPRDEQTPDALAAFHKAEIDKWWPIIRSAGLKAQ